MKRLVKTLGLGVCALLVGASCGPTGAQQQNELTPERYVVPENANVDELITFIDGLVTFEPSSRAETEAHQQHARDAVLKASNRVIELEMDKKSPNYSRAFLFKVQVELGSLASASLQRQEELLASVNSFFAEKGSLDANDLALAERLASSLESIENPASQALAAEAYLTFAKKFEGMSPMAKYFEGSHRRLTLVGKELQLTGTDLDGNEIDVALLKDSVVLVDFWATWCRPCVAEIPNVLKLYNRYKERGLVVIGVSLDQQLPNLEAFIENNKIPWPTIAASIGEGNEALARYGVMTIPQMIVVGRDGKVLATGVRGEELTRILSEQFSTDDK